MSILIMELEIWLKGADSAISSILLVLFGGRTLRSLEGLDDLALVVFVASKRLKSHLIRQRLFEVFEFFILISLKTALNVLIPISTFYMVICDGLLKISMLIPFSSGRGLLLHILWRLTFYRTLTIFSVTVPILSLDVVWLHVIILFCKILHFALTVRIRSHELPFQILRHLNHSIGDHVWSLIAIYTIIVGINMARRRWLLLVIL